MYEMSIDELEMNKVFGKAHRNLLYRNGLRSVKEVKEYIEKYPFEEYSKHHATHYRYIGPVKYNQIVEALNKWEES